MSTENTPAVLRPLADEAQEMLRSGLSVEEVSRRTGIGKRIIAAMDHAMALMENESVILERLEELAALAAGDFTNFAVRDYAAKQFCKWLFQAGM